VRCGWFWIEGEHTSRWAAVSSIAAKIGCTAQTRPPVIWLVEDRNASGIWRVEYQDDNGGCYVTIFAGPVAERRARTYYEALQANRLPTIREGARSRERSS
jgi:hypothetical protein